MRRRAVIVLLVASLASQSCSLRLPAPLIPSTGVSRTTTWTPEARARARRAPPLRPTEPARPTDTGAEGAYGAMFALGTLGALVGVALVVIGLPNWRETPLAGIGLGIAAGGGIVATLGGAGLGAVRRTQRATFGHAPPVAARDPSRSPVSTSPARRWRPRPPPARLPTWQLPAPWRPTSAPATR